MSLSFLLVLSGLIFCGCSKKHAPAPVFRQIKGRSSANEQKSQSRSPANQYRVVTIISTEAELFDSLAGNSLNVKLNKGTKTNYLAHDQGWYHIRLRNGLAAWVPGWDAEMRNDSHPLTNLPDEKNMNPSRARPFVVRVASDLALARSAPTNNLSARSDTSRIGYFEKDTLLKIIQFKDHWCKAELTRDVFAWVYDEMLEPAKEAALGSPAVIKQIKDVSHSRAHEIRISLNRRIPYILNHEKDGIVLTLYGAVLVNDPSDIPQSPGIQQGRDFVRIAQKLPGAAFGYAARFDGNTLVFTVKKPIRTAGSNSLQGITIIIDPGHGSATRPRGFKEGAPGRLELKEEEINLSVAKRLLALVENRGGKAILTRTGPSDSMLSLYSRVDFAIKNKGDLFVSIHANTRGGKLRGAFVYWYDKQSIELAHKISEQMLKVNPSGGPGVGFSSFGVIRMTDMPAVLVELGYIDNKEAELFRDSYFLNQCAAALFEGLVDYMDSLRNSY